MLCLAIRGRARKNFQIGIHNRRQNRLQLGIEQLGLALERLNLHRSMSEGTIIGQDSAYEVDYVVQITLLDARVGFSYTGLEEEAVEAMFEVVQ